MTNKFYSPGAGRAARVNDLFTAVAARYDLINDLQSFGLHRVWKRKLVRMAAADSAVGTRALDLCCGTGDVAFALASRGMEVVGLDFSEAMLAVARRRARREAAGPGRVEFMLGDAQQTPFPEESFDVVTISYGLRNLENLEAGLREMRRVTRPGGRLLALDFGKPENGLWRAMYFGYLGRCVPLLGRWFCGDADTHGYILESLRHFPAQQGVAAFMRDLGLEEVRIVNLLGGVMSITCAQRPGRG